MSIACPHCGEELNAGQLLAELARGKHRRMTPAHKAKLAASLVKAREVLRARRQAQTKTQWTMKPLVPIWTKGVL